LNFWQVQDSVTFLKRLKKSWYPVCLLMPTLYETYSRFRSQTFSERVAIVKKRGKGKGKERNAKRVNRERENSARGLAWIVPDAGMHGIAVAFRLVIAANSITNWILMESRQKPRHPSLEICTLRLSPINKILRLITHDSFLFFFFSRICRDRSLC